MGANQSAQIGIGAKSTAKEVNSMFSSTNLKRRSMNIFLIQVIETFGEGKYLSGKTAIVTGGSSGIG